MLKAKLVVVGGNTPFEQIDLKLPVVIGRGTDADLAVTDELISRRHAEICERNGRLFVRDLGSRNGTFVNNRRIDSASSLEPDQLLTLGTVTFRALYCVDEGSQHETVGLGETVRINFNETERISRTRSSGENQDDLETLDLDDYISQQQNRAGHESNGLAARETIYARQEAPFSTEATTPNDSLAGSSSDSRAAGAAEYLRRRFPK
jgi:predicted component of type VI protein secretion system